MKHLFVPFLLSFTILVLPGQRSSQSVAQTSASPNEVRYEARWDDQQSGVTQDLLAIHFINPKEGWAVGKSNTIIRTNDGGHTWKRLLEDQGGPDFTGVRFASSTDGWAQSHTILLHTSDGGDSWQPTPQLQGSMGFGGSCLLGSTWYQMHPPTAGAGVFKTQAGGQWEQIGNKPSRNDYGAVFFLDSQHGWLAGDYGVFALTEDGGRTWKETKLLDANLTKIQFITPSHGWILPRRGHNGGPLVTNDGGNTWTGQYVGVQSYRNLEDMDFLSEKDGFLLSEHTVHRTADGGKTWKTIGKFQANPLALSFPRVDEGWAVGSKGFISHYHLVPIPVKK